MHVVLLVYIMLDSVTFIPNNKRPIVGGPMSLTPFWQVDNACPVFLFNVHGLVNIKEHVSCANY